MTTKFIHGVGINDATYKTQIKKTIGYFESGEPIRKLEWICPFYQKWKSMPERCYSSVVHSRYLTYTDCSTAEEWHLFSNFKAWMETQDWEDKCLDKDILFPGNKIYSPEACVFVDQKVNKFIIESNKSRGEWPIGVDFHKKAGKFRASCNNVITGRREYLGLYNTPEEAYHSWLTFKLEQAHILASMQTDPRIAEALINRYSPKNCVV